MKDKASRPGLVGIVLLGALCAIAVFAVTVLAAGAVIYAGMFGALVCTTCTDGMSPLMVAGIIFGAGTVVGALTFWAVYRGMRH